MKKLLSIFVLTSFIMGSAVAISPADVCNPYDEMQDQALRDLGALRSEYNKYLPHDEFMEHIAKVIGYGLRVHSLRIAPAGCAHSKQQYIDFVRPYLAQIDALDVSKSIMADRDKREIYAQLLENRVYCLINQYPLLSEAAYQGIVKEYESDLALVLKEDFGQTTNVERDAQQIVTVLDTLTVSYYQTMLFPEQQALLKTIDKVE